MSAQQDLSPSDRSGTPRVQIGAGDGPTGDAADAKATSVVVTLPEELFRAGLVRYLDGHPDIRVVADAANNTDGLDRCQAQRPLVLICDGDCERLPVQQLTRRLRLVSPDTRALVVGRNSLDPETILRWGGWGIISRSSSGELFARAVRVIAGGQYWVGRDILTQLARKALHPEQEAPKAKRVLSARESEILILVSDGKTNDQIAEALYIEVNTVRTHLRRIYQKLNVHDRTSAVVTASRNGYIQLPGR